MWVFRGHCPYCGRDIPRYVLQNRKDPGGYMFMDTGGPFGSRMVAMQPVLSRWHCPCGRLSLDMWVTAIMGDTGRLPDGLRAMSPNPPDPKPNLDILVPLMDGEKRRQREDT